MTATKQVELSGTSIRNGPGAAAVLSAAIGCFALGVIAVVADKLQTFARALIFYRPTGPLSGVTSAAIVIWLLTWAGLHALWRKRNVRLKLIASIAILLLIAALLLTFPPIGDLL